MKTRYHVVIMFVLLSVTSLLQAGVTNVLLGYFYQCCLDTGQDVVEMEVAKKNDRPAKEVTAARGCNRAKSEARHAACCKKEQLNVNWHAQQNHGGCYDKDHK